MNLGILKTEITDDPVSRGYSGMSNKDAATDLNIKYRTKNKETMSSTEVMNAIDKNEFNVLSADNKQLIWNILHISNINPFGIEADLFVDVFGGGSVTISSLTSLRVVNISRAVELGLGKIREGHVLEARL